MSATREAFGEFGEHLSIIIPTYDCATYLVDTLQALQKEGRELANAQIAVVDDHSTNDDPQSVLDRRWPGRVQFFRHPRNIGPCANFNACIDAAEREWIHILHGDDFVLPGTYEEFARCLTEHRDAIAVFARSVEVNEKGYWLGVSGLLGPEQRGMLRYHPSMWAFNPVFFPGVLVSRRAISLVGKFDCTFTHVQDWNLWWRIARTDRAAYTNVCVGVYRTFPENHTSSLRSSGRNHIEAVEQVKRLIASTQNDKRFADVDVSSLYEPVYNWILAQSWNYLGDGEAFAANLGVLKMLPARYRRRLKVPYLVSQRWKTAIAGWANGATRSNAQRGE